MSFFSIYTLWGLLSFGHLVVESYFQTVEVIGDHYKHLVYFYWDYAWFEQRHFEIYVINVSRVDNMKDIHNLLEFIINISYNYKEIIQFLVKSYNRSMM